MTIQLNLPGPSNAIATGRYDAIISLGSNCAPAQAIRRYFKVGAAFPFDWWISTLDDLLSAFRQDFSDMFLPSEIEAYKVSDWSVRSSRYGIAYHHDFSRSETGYEIRSILKELPSVTEKYNRRFRRLRSVVVSGRILFIRYGIDVRGATQMESLETIYQLEQAITSLWPNANFNLLALPYDEPITPMDTKLSSKTAVDNLGPQTGEMWREAQFFELFQRRGLQISRTPLIGVEDLI